MAVQRLDVAGFLEHAGQFLLEREAEHNLLLGLTSRLGRAPRFYGSDPYLAVAEQDGRVVGAALRTPPRGLILSEIDDERAVEALVADVRDVFDSLPGVLGPVAAARRFVELWEAPDGTSARLAVSERIYRADSVSPPAGVPGRARPYHGSDRELALRWFTAFVDEALPDGSPESPDEVLEHRLSDPDGGLVIWDDGGPVSLAGFGGATPNGIRIGPVYTPPDRRGRGYGSALSADVTASLLASGRRFCFLFTDHANPASNSIYQRIGYRPVCDVDQWLLG